MSSFLRAIFVGGLASILLAGCAAAPPRQAFNKTANADIKTIYVLPMQPTKLSVFMLNNPAVSFGLIGGLIASAQQASEEKDIRAFQAQADFKPLQYFKASLTRDMQARGYTLVWPDSLLETGKPDTDGFNLRKEYAPVTQGDAELDVAFGFFGYAAGGAGKGSPYRPTINMGARLVGRDGKQNLFTDSFAYNNVFNIKQAITIEAGPTFSYPMFSDLKAAGTQSMDGLKLALDSLADSLAKQL